MTAPDPGDPPGSLERAPPIVGLRREREVLTVALDTGRHVVIEGPPGTGKSTLLRDIARHAGKAVVFAEGNAELTPARLIGQYDPAQVLADGYVPAAFTDGPLLRAMRSGALLCPPGPPSQSCQDLGLTTPGNSANSPGSPFNEPSGSNPGGIGGQHYSETSQYDVACFQQSQHQ
jgi:dynein-related subfamily AAA family protein